MVLIEAISPNLLLPKLRCARGLNLRRPRRPRKDVLARSWELFIGTKILLPPMGKRRAIGRKSVTPFTISLKALSPNGRWG